MSKTIFSRIIDGEIPSYKIYENPYVYAFLDIHPVRPGHVLIVPRTPVAYFADLEEPFYSEVFQAAKYLAPLLDAAMGCERVGMIVAGLDVPHVHIHLIPLRDAADLDLSQTMSVTPEELVAVQKTILTYIN